ncbi:hypothetical protein, partial [Niastella populi]|uniref:hypothetical protein n=1 Tax=Niastella populi TaxID=550983 RepID=UPI001A98067A
RFRLSAFGLRFCFGSSAFCFLPLALGFKLYSVFAFAYSLKLTAYSCIRFRLSAFAFALDLRLFAFCLWP